MAQKNKFRQLSAAEKAIGLRIADARRLNRCHQDKLAQCIGISRDQLSSLEIGRVALPTRRALQIAEVLKINLLWLAEGIGPMLRFLHIPQDLVIKANENKYFSEAYNLVLRDFFHKDWENIKGRNLEGFFGADQIHQPDPVPQNITSASACAENLRAEFASIPPILHTALMRKISAGIREFNEMHGEEIQTFLNHQSRMDVNKSPGARTADDYSCEEILDVWREVAINDGVKTKVLSLPDLLNQLRKKTEKRGQKSALARKLKVSRQAVDQWLSGKSKPSADATLELLKLVG